MRDEPPFDGRHSLEMADLVLRALAFEPVDARQRRLAGNPEDRTERRQCDRHQLIVARGATQALEIGGAHGYSAIWIGLGLRQTGGHLTTIEFDPARARSAADHIRRAGLSDIVTVVTGDAFKEIPKVAGDFDFVFLDAWKRDYKRFFDLVFPRLQPRGLFLAHNVVNKAVEMRDFLDAIQNNPSLETTIVKPSGEGMSVSVRVKP